MMLLAASGFFVKSLMNVSRVDLGIKADNVITFAISPELNGYTPEKTRLFFERLEDELHATPGVTGVTVAPVPLLAGSNWGNDVSVQGFQAGPDADSNSRFNEIGPGYFATMGVPLIAGREFTDVGRVRRDESGHRQRGVRQEVQPRPRRRRQDDRVGQRLPQQAGHDDRRRGPERQVQRGEAQDPAGVLPALPAGSTLGSASRSTSARRRIRRRWRRASPRS